jgi:hypothetical protein
MERQHISRILTLALVTLLLTLALGAPMISAAPGQGEVDPTGLDLNGSRITEPLRAIEIREAYETQRLAAEYSAMRWIESFLMKDFLRRLSF